MSIKAIRRLASATFCLLMIISLCPISFSSRVFADNKEKLTADEVVSRHLKSIGSEADLASIKTRIIAGSSLLSLRAPGTGQNSGLSILFSEANKNVIAMSFSNPTYPHEKFGYDGDKLVISYLQPGRRSTLGDFIYQRSAIFKDGLVGGALSTAWPLLHLDKERVKLEYAGAKNVQNRQTHVLRYMPRKGSDVKISLFFDAQTFQHVRTEYTQTVSAQMGGSPDASKEFQRELRYELVEEFSEFKPEGKMTLPHNYKIKLKLERRSGGTYLAEWEMVFSKFSFNQPLEAKWFDVTAT